MSFLTLADLALLGAGAAPPVLWTPAQIMPAIWVDPSTASSITLNGSTASQASDLSGNGRHITQATASQQPVYSIAAQNGLNVLTFDGSNDILSNANVGASGLSNVTIIAVMRMISGGSNEDLPMGIGATNNSGAIRSLYRASSGTTVGFAGWSSDVTSSSEGYDIGGSYHIFGGWNTQLATPSNVRIMRDGVVSTYTSSATLVATVNGFSIGSLQGTSVGNYYSNISVGEVLVFYSAINDTNRQLCEGYLAHKWGLAGLLPAGHPYKSAPPYV